MRIAGRERECLAAGKAAQAFILLSPSAIPYALGFSPLIPATKKRKGKGWDQLKERILCQLIQHYKTVTRGK